MHHQTHLISIFPKKNMAYHINGYATPAAGLAALRQMKREVCCKSQFKFLCTACGEHVNRGDKITKAMTCREGMTLRFRGCDSTSPYCGPADTNFYQPNTGDVWVHIGCIPYWFNTFTNKYEKHMTAFTMDPKTPIDFPLKYEITRMNRAAGVIQRAWLSRRTCNTRVWIVMDKFTKAEKVYRGKVTDRVSLPPPMFLIVTFSDGEKRMYHPDHLSLLNHEGLRRIYTGPTLSNFSGMTDLNYGRLLKNIKKKNPQSGCIIP